MQMMTPVICVVDDFLSDPEGVLADILTGEFVDTKGPTDEETYQFIQYPLAKRIHDQFINGLEFALSTTPTKISKIETVFARAMPTGVVMPTFIHSDLSIAKYAAHVYIGAGDHPSAGTLFFSHATEGAAHTPMTNIEKVDFSNDEEWTSYMHVRYKRNRLLVHRGDHWHAALPHGGWGANVSESRIVLSCFFN